MWGFHDHSLSMRKALNETMITSKPNNSLYRRWRWAQSVQNEKECRRKLDKAHRLFSLIHQCEKLELENEKVLFSSLKTDSNQLNFLSDCHLQIDDSFADQLTLFWKRFAHVQLDLFSRIKQKKSNLQKANQLFQLTKYESGVVSSR